MNDIKLTTLEHELLKCFRPQQGLTIMNLENETGRYTRVKKEFPSPTGVNYYESQ